MENYVQYDLHRKGTSLVIDSDLCRTCYSTKIMNNHFALTTNDKHSYRFKRNREITYMTLLHER